MKKLLHSFGLAAFFFISFLFFVVLTFDYGILKEAITSQISRQSGYNLTVGSLGPAFPFGVSVEDLRVQAPSAQSLSVKKIRAKVSLLPLLLGKVGFWVEVEEKSQGYLAIGGHLGLIDLMAGAFVLPSSLELEAKAFTLDEFVAFFLRQAANNPTTDPLLAPFLGQLGFRGKLNGIASFSIDTSSPNQSSGDMKVSLSDAVLVLSNPSIGLADQKLSLAKIHASIQKGNLVVAEGSGIKSSELEVSLNGRVSLAKTMTHSTVDLRIVVRLLQSLKENLGIILSAMGGSRASEGEVSMELTGQLGQPIVKSF